MSMVRVLRETYPDAGAGNVSTVVTNLNEHQFCSMGQSRVKAVTQKAVAGGHCAGHRAVPLPVKRTGRVGPRRRLLRLKVENRNRITSRVSPNTNTISRPHQVGMRIESQRPPER